MFVSGRGEFKDPTFSKSHSKRQVRDHLRISTGLLAWTFLQKFFFVVVVI